MKFQKLERNAPIEQVLYSTPDVAARTSLSVSTIQRMIKDGRLPSVLVGSARRVKHDDLTTMIDELQVEVGIS